MIINKGVKLNKIKEALAKHREIFKDKSCGYHAFSRRFYRGWSLYDIINTPNKGRGGNRSKSLSIKTINEL